MGAVCMCIRVFAMYSRILFAIWGWCMGPCICVGVADSGCG